MIKLLRDRKFVCGTALAAGILGLGIGQALLQKRAEAQGSTVQAPIFEVDPLWPKPLPNNWLLGWTIGIWVDELDHVWVIHRGAGGLHNNERGAELSPPIAECCRTAPPILVYDSDGTLLRTWGGPGPGYEWPQSNHGIHVDYKGSNDQENFGRVAKIWVDPKTNEAYIADGYLNKRVAVIDADTGKMKRYWGAYGNKPDDANLGPYDPKAPPAQQFRNPVHCIERSVDDLVYVCDRQNDRLQVFKPDGTFVKEQFYARNTKGAGAVWDIVFSKDPQQRFIMLADGQNERVRVIVRETLEEITSFGDGGRQPGQFYGVHSIAADSKGNFYTTETYEGKRVQKFVYRGISSQARGYQGVLWPR